MSMLDPENMDATIAEARDEIKRAVHQRFPILVMQNRPVDEGHAFVLDLPDRDCRLRITVTEEK